MMYRSIRALDRSFFEMTPCFNRAFAFCVYSLVLAAVKKPRSSFLTLCGSFTIASPSMSLGRSNFSGAGNFA